MIEIVKNEAKTKKVTDPYYKLTYNYMIGDANGSTKETVRLSLNNPHIERFVKLVNSIRATKGTWGFIMDHRNLEKAFKEKQFNEEDYKFLKTTLFSEDLDEEDDDFEDDYLYEFFEGVRGETEYSFLVFQGVSLNYIDEFGVSHSTKIN